MLGILKFFFPAYWQRRENVLTKKRDWKRSIKFLNIGGTRTKAPVLPEKRLNFNEQSKHIRNETIKISSANDSSKCNDNLLQQGERISNSYECIQ